MGAVGAVRTGTACSFVIIFKLLDKLRRATAIVKHIDDLRHVTMVAMSAEEIYNFRRVGDRVITGGHPTEQQLRDVAAEHFTAVVNLAPVDRRSC